MGLSRPLVRPRRDEDLPLLLEILERQQEQTQYPFSWPPPGDPVEFVRRPTELAAWVAEVDGRVVGHVGLHRVSPDDELAGLGARAHGVPVGRLRAVEVLFVDRGVGGRGVGSALLATATEHALADGGAPVLDVVSEHEGPVALYLRRGWQVVGRFRPGWLPEDLEPVLVMVLPLSDGLSRSR